MPDSISWCKSLPRHSMWRHHLQGNHTGALADKTFAKKNCGLCVKEKCTIFKQSGPSLQLLIASNNKICGACGHRLRHRFHRSAKQTPFALMSQSMMNELSHSAHSVTFAIASCLTGSMVRTNQKRSFSICFQSSSLRKQFQQFAMNQSLMAAQHVNLVWPFLDFNQFSS